ncbi:O-antigen ligase family protein [Coprothermobacteraceae bacterium]|nr:O-antigen ligase family protein [Coprothermobacteraceae bacterium]
MWRAFTAELRKTLPTKWEALFIAFVAAYNVYFSLNPWRSLVFWLAVPLAFSLIVLLIVVLPERADKTKLAWLTGLMLLVALAWTIWHNRGVTVVGWRTFRLTLPLVVSTTAAAIFSYLFLYTYTQHAFWAELWSLLGILLTQSRGPILGLAMAVLYGGVSPLWFVLLIGFLIYAVPYTMREFVGPYAFYTQRFHIWKAAWDMFVMRPLSGVGLGAFPQALAIYSHPVLYEFFPFNHAHNILLHLLAETGLGGVLVYAILLKNLIKAFPPSSTAKGRFLRLSLVAYLGRNIFDVTP